MGLNNDRTWRKHLKIVVPTGPINRMLTHLLTKNDISFIASLDPDPGPYYTYEADTDCVALRNLLKDTDLKFDERTNLVC